MVAQSRGAKFQLSIKDLATNTCGLEPRTEIDREICATALEDIAKHMRWDSTEVYLHNMDGVKHQILRERNKT